MRTRELFGRLWYFVHVLLPTPDSGGPLSSSVAAAVAAPEPATSAPARHSHRSSHPFQSSFSYQPPSAIAPRPALRPIDLTAYGLPGSRPQHRRRHVYEHPWMLLGSGLDARGRLRMLRQAGRRPSFGPARTATIPQRRDVRHGGPACRLRHRIRRSMYHAARPELYGVRWRRLPWEGVLLRPRCKHQRDGAVVLPAGAVSSPDEAPSFPSPSTAGAVRLRCASAHQLSERRHVHHEGAVRKRPGVLLRRRHRPGHGGICVFPPQQAASSFRPADTRGAAAEPDHAAAVQSTHFTAVQATPRLAPGHAP